MRKEVLYAVIFGVTLGGVILFGINLANKSIDSLNTVTDTTTPSISPTPPTTNHFAITKPQNHAVIPEKTATVFGTGTPNSTLALVTEIDDLIIEINPTGTFSAQINLVPGENTIVATNLLPDGKTASESITVIQSSNLPE